LVSGRTVPSNPAAAAPQASSTARCEVRVSATGTLKSRVSFSLWTAIRVVVLRSPVGPGLSITFDMGPAGPLTTNS
jgi:hypothetical protein